MAADEEDTVVSLQDVLEENRQLEETANAVLGPSDDSSCTYSNGYVDRQAVYACATCSRAKQSLRKTEAASEKKEGEGEDEDLAGVCLACSLHCHDGHELYELYTKRQFRCDCGNLKFPSDNPCTLCPDKAPTNSLNTYSHNFRGLYCTCNRPYPDPEDDVEDEMIQCCVCEDWFHSRHLGGVGGPPEGYEEMVCDSCMTKHSFLEAYRLAPAEKVVKSEVSEDVRVDVGDTSVGGSCDQSHDQSCELARRRRVAGKQGEGAGYFASSWRSTLCRCSNCMSLYKEGSCLYLLDESDTISCYEARAGSLPTSHESAMTAFSSSLDRVHQVEAIHQYNDMKTELVGFLQGFATDKKVVSRRDVETFFEGMEARKRRRLETGEGVPPANCHF